MDQLRGDLAAERKSRRDYQMASDKSNQIMKRLEQKIVRNLTSIRRDLESNLLCRTMALLSRFL